jgi:amino acid transporter
MDAKDTRNIHGDGRSSETSLVERPLSVNAIDERKEHFGLWSTLGLSFSIMSTPISIASALILSVGVGGSPVYIFAYCVAFIFQVFVCLSLAEMTGAFPHPSGEASL